MAAPMQKTILLDMICDVRPILVTVLHRRYRLMLIQSSSRATLPSIPLSSLSHTFDISQEVLLCH